ncbi:MAG: FHA domain-containing protein [Pseudomonadota bacterium]
MASENKNLHNLAPETDASTVDNTSELEILSVDLMPTEAELELDAKTYSLELGDDEEDEDWTSLQSDLRSKDERISNLQFDIEQLRARWTGLEKEISAREELTEMLQADLRLVQEELATKEDLVELQIREISTLAEKVESLQISNRDAKTSVAHLETENQSLTEQAEQQDATLAELREKLRETEALIPPEDDPRDRIIADTRQALDELNTYVDGRKDEWERQNSELDALKSDLAEAEEFTQHQSEKLTDATEKLKNANATNTRLGADLKEARDSIKTNKDELRKVNNTLRQLKETSLSEADHTIEVQHGELAKNREQIAVLETYAARADRYADELREKLCSAFEEKSSALAHTERLSDEITVLTARLEENRASLEAAEEATEVANRTRDESVGAAHSETSQLRELLEKAEASSDDKSTTIEELEASLNESRAFKKILEDQLTSFQDESDKELNQLHDRVSTLEEELESTSRKLSSKDKAVAALLSELARKSKTIESIDEIESAIHDIDHQMSKRIDERSADKERPTRLLVGKIDGQTLRFPLFKDRLTIGRTVQNDIQIRAHYISRRHAIVISDEDGTKIVDWGSKNGVFVNDKRVSEQALAAGDNVKIGTAEFIYEEIARHGE